MNEQLDYDELISRHVNGHLLLPMQAWFMAQDKYMDQLLIPVQELFDVFWAAYGPLLHEMTEEGTRDAIWQADLEMLPEGKFDALVVLINAKMETLDE